MNMKKTIITALGLLLTAASSASPATTVAAGGSGSEAQTRRVFRVALDSEPVSLDIHAQLAECVLQLSHMAFDPLLRWTQDHQLVGRLAERWTMSDPLTLRLHLRQGVRFHSGNPFTAEDVAWTISRVKASEEFSTLMRPIEKVVVVDAHTIDIKTLKPEPLLPHLMADIFPMDHKFYSEGAAKEKPQERGTFAATHVSGSGPFKVSESVRGVKIVFDRNPDYWDKETGNVDQIVMTPIKAAATRVSALLAGDVDFISPVPPTDFERLKSTKGVKVHSLSSPMMVMLQFNMPKVKAFQDIRVRRAVNLAINRQAIAEKLMKGLATPAGQIVPVMYAGHVPELNYKHDLDEAKRLMAEAGYKDGLRISMMAPNNRYINDEKVAAAVAAMLAKIGITADLKTQPKTKYFPSFIDKQGDLMMIGWATDLEDSVDYFEYLTACPEGSDGLSAYNLGSYCNKTLDGLLAQSRTETQTDKRRAMLESVSRGIYEDAALVPLHWQRISWASKEGIAFEEIVNPNNLPYWGNLKL